MLNLNYGPLESNFWGDYCKYDFDLWPMSQNQEWKSDFLSTTTNEAPMLFQIILQSVYALRQQILSTFDTRIKTITTANGYQTNLGNHIFEWRVTALDPATEMPGAIYKDIQDTIDLTTGLHLHTLEIEISSFTKGSTSPSDMRKLIGDIHEMIGTDVTWGGLAEDTKIESEEITATQVSELIINVKTKIGVEFTTNLFDPFS